MRFALALLLSVGVAVCALADVVHLKNGEKLEGKVLEQKTSEVVIQTRFGRQSIARSRIDRVEIKATPKETLAQREKAVAADDAEGLYALAAFARENKLRKDFERMIDRVLEADPDHAGANLVRDRVKHGGEWMTSEERDQRLLEEREATMRARGLVPYKGRWVTPGEKANFEKGLVLHGGQWMTDREAKRAQGLVRLEDGPIDRDWAHVSEVAALRAGRAFARDHGLTLVEQSRPHVVVATNLGEDLAREIADDGEKAYEYARAALRLPDSLDWLGGQKAWLFVLADREQFELFCAFFARSEEKVDDRWAKSVARADGFYWWDPTGTSATFKGPRSPAQVRGRCVHQLGHVLLNRYQFNYKFLPTWVDEGYAALMEFEVLRDNTTSCLATRVYGRSEVRDASIPPAGGWRSAIVNLMEEKRDPSLRSLEKKDFSNLEAMDIAKGMAVIEYWRDQRQDEFLDFLHRLRQEWPTGRPRTTSPVIRQAFQNAYRAFGDAAIADQLDAEVRRNCTLGGR